MTIAGLTGGTGSGKSTAARRFETHGIPVIDADATGHAMIAPGGPAEAEVVAAFGDGILTCGRIDREKLGALVFADPGERERLNRIVHPKMASVIAAQCAEYARVGRSACIVDAALLGEGAALEPWLDCLILVSCPEAVRVRRLVAGRGLDEARARQRIAAQMDPERKRPLARWVIENGGTLDGLHTQVDAVARALLQGGAEQEV